MRRGKMGLAIASATAVAFIGASASGQVLWSDGFEGYAPGSGLMGQGGWTAWGDDVAWDSLVSDAQANSGTNSVDIVGDSDTVYRWDINHGTIDCGAWQLTFQLFVPNDLAGESYFILLNEYDGTTNNWSTQVHIDSVTGNYIGDFTGETLPLIQGAWHEWVVDIDLDNDTQTVTIGGDMLYTGTWTDQVSGGGQLEIQAMDLFANAASSVFYDDFQLEQVGDCPEPQCLTLDVDKLIGGTRTTWTITDNGVGGNDVVALVWGLQAGETNINGFADYCASFGIKGVNQNRLICQGRLTAGVKECEKPIPAGMVGTEVLFQAAMKGTCPDPCMSNLWIQTIQ